MLKDAARVSVLHSSALDYLVKLANERYAVLAQWPDFTAAVGAGPRGGRGGASTGWDWRCRVEAEVGNGGGGGLKGLERGLGRG